MLILSSGTASDVILYSIMEAGFASSFVCQGHNKHQAIQWLEDLRSRFPERRFELYENRVVPDAYPEVQPYVWIRLREEIDVLVAQSSSRKLWNWKRDGF
jgi:hypothetical protein